MSSAIESSSSKCDSVGPPEYANQECFRGAYTATFPRGNGDRQHDRYFVTHI